jgi:hypothetical protein
MLKIPNTIPIMAGRTKSNRLIVLSAVKERPVREDSNRVRRTRNKVESNKRARDFTPRLNFIKVFPRK